MKTPHRMNLSTRTRAGALVLASLGVALVTAQQPGTASRFPLLVADLTAPAIDRGLRDNDPPRDPRTGSTARIVRDEPFERGSIIVKFRAGTTAVARRAMLAQVDGVAMQAPPYATFDIVAIDPAEDPEAVARRL